MQAIIPRLQATLDYLAYLLDWDPPLVSMSRHLHQAARRKQATVLTPSLNEVPYLPLPPLQTATAEKPLAPQDRLARAFISHCLERPLNDTSLVTLSTFTELQCSSQYCLLRCLRLV